MLIHIKTSNNFFMFPILSTSCVDLTKTMSRQSLKPLNPFRKSSDPIKAGIYLRDNQNQRRTRSGVTGRPTPPSGNHMSLCRARQMFATAVYTCLRILGTLKGTFVEMPHIFTLVLKIYRVPNLYRLLVTP